MVQFLGILIMNKMLLWSVIRKHNINVTRFSYLAAVFWISKSRIEESSLFVTTILIWSCIMCACFIILTLNYSWMYLRQSDKDKEKHRERKGTREEEGKKKEKDTKGVWEIDLQFTGSFSKWPSLLGQGQAESRGLGLYPGLQVFGPLSVGIPGILTWSRMSRKQPGLGLRQGFPALFHY